MDRDFNIKKLLQTLIRPLLVVITISIVPIGVFAKEDKKSAKKFVDRNQPFDRFTKQWKKT